MKNYYISEGVKALFSIYFKDQTEENFIKALNEFAKESQINSQEIKDKSFREFKEAISKLPTIDLLNTRFDKLENSVDKLEYSIGAKLDKLENSIGAKLDKPEDSVCAKLNKLENSIGAKLDKPEDSVCAKLNKLENKLDSFKREVRTYVIILAALMFILQPTIFDLILSIFKSFLRQ
ncbi:hypothetical protein GHL12_08130 [Campylobacter jejuni]|uniref:hypothetical protein n=2 Tax=Campylobacteraceae TaxID=72294 RepID=UPI0008751510|nr:MULTISPECIES: hypothetical protein [unclassified Campylobacter]EDF9110185.1 hypothetical protein [Campylobacter jejuni]EDK9199749.1 hypothetical protein [Campylobacter jejuni]EKY8179290.1 hypothetical protein [Campylobacter jejuni]OEW72187.1 hypothetical protein AJN60_00410 [Campylobacter sp. BCW_4323]PCH17813.1 hypothetical protein BGS41_09075 [Campylobacter sp. 108]